MKQEVRCKHIILNKRTGKREVCDKKLGEFEGAYRLRCPRCKKDTEGDTRA